MGRNDRYFMSSVKIGPKGQIVIPKEARQIFGVQQGDTLLILGDEENGMIVTKPDVLNNLAAKILDQIGNEK